MTSPRTAQLTSDLWSSVGALIRAATKIEDCDLNSPTELEDARSQIAYALANAARVSSLVDFRITSIFEGEQGQP